jgi:hypothetical protein
MTKSLELAHLFRALKAPAAARALPKLAARAREEQWGYERFAEALLSAEVASRESHGGESRIKAARFPARKTLEEFGFSFQRSVRRPVVEHLGQLDFLHAKENVVLLGPPGPDSHCTSPPPSLVKQSSARAGYLNPGPLRRPWVTWTACSSPRWSLCKTVWRAMPSALAASASGR